MLQPSLRDPDSHRNLVETWEVGRFSLKALLCSAEIPQAKVRRSNV